MQLDVGKKPNPFRPNAWGMITQIFLALINKGQLLMGLVGVILIIAFIKMTTTQIYSLCHETLALMESFHILGWVSSAILTPLFIYLYSRTKKIHQEEIEKLSKQLQKGT